MEPEVFPVREDGVLPGEEGGPVVRMNHLARGHGPVVDHDQLHPPGRNPEARKEFGERKRPVQFAAE